MTAGASPGDDDAPGIAARRRYLVRQTVVAAMALVAATVVNAVIVRTAGPPRRASTSTTLVLLLAAIGVVVILMARWCADLRSPQGRALWTLADRDRVSTVRAYLVQRMPLAPQDRQEAAAVVALETSPIGRLAWLVETAVPLVVPALPFALSLSVGAGIGVVLILGAVIVGPRVWMRRRLLSGARAEGLAPGRRR